MLLTEHKKEGALAYLRSGRVVLAYLRSGELPPPTSTSGWSEGVVVGALPEVATLTSYERRHLLPTTFGRRRGIGSARKAVVGS
jgi:hypothetical protein